MNLFLITENKKKLGQYQELQKRLAPEMFALLSKMIATVEIQSVDVEEVIRDKVEQMRKAAHLPFIVDDVSLLVGSGTYPGALVKHVLQQNNFATLKQFLPDNAPATVVCSIGYFDGFETFIFKGQIEGIIRHAQADVNALPSLDQLIHVNGTPLGELDCVNNHRGKAFAELVKHVNEMKGAREKHNDEVAERWSSRAENWESVRKDVASYVNHEDGYTRFDAEVRRVLPLAAGAAVDIGCGDGDVARLITESADITKVLGMDISPEMIRVAAEKTSDPRLRYEAGLFSDTGNRYGLITSRGVVLSHMHRSDVIPTFTAMANSLAPNGYLIFDYISNLSNHDDSGRLEKNQLEKNWIIGVFYELGLVNVSFSGSDAHRVSVLVFHKPTDQSLYFATGNATKVMELRNRSGAHELQLANVDVQEIKSADIMAIAKDKAKKSYELLKHSVIVTDGGIFINALNGFPGANSKQAATLLGPKKLLSLLLGEADRSAIRRNCMVFFDGKEFKACVAEVPLLISDHVTESEHKAYPMDAILIPVHPENPDGLTYKQMPVPERVRFTELPVFERFIETL